MTSLVNSHEEFTGGIEVFFLKSSFLEEDKSDSNFGFFFVILN